MTRYVLTAAAAKKPTAGKSKAQELLEFVLSDLPLLLSKIDDTGKRTPHGEPDLFGYDDWDEGPQWTDKEVYKGLEPSTKKLVPFKMFREALQSAVHPEFHGSDVVSTIRNTKHDRHIEFSVDEDGTVKMRMRTNAEHEAILEEEDVQSASDLGDELERIARRHKAKGRTSVKEILQAAMAKKSQEARSLERNFDLIADALEAVFGTIPQYAKDSLLKAIKADKELKLLTPLKTVSHNLTYTWVECVGQQIGVTVGWRDGAYSLAYMEDRRTVKDSTEYPTVQACISAIKGLADQLCKEAAELAKLPPKPAKKPTPKPSAAPSEHGKALVDSIKRMKAKKAKKPSLKPSARPPR